MRTRLILAEPPAPRITEYDVPELQFPYDEVDEMEAEDFGRRACCNSIPCRFGGCEVN